MKEKLTIDQKIQIAQIAATLTQATINNAHKIPVQNALSIDTGGPYNDQLFLTLFDIVAKKITDGPENY
ncbi:hypothetical protein [Erwinia sp. HR93]|uniref:hypothetical protein n=1 Tax=Erwinia sp. HR93 TaxID=3094840 RepID=UPI0029C3B660|nr:hypothetical protein [Erwinia sp. HR93]MEA1062262.1 hypothetical protein [Erwinia sp. HR93]MEA1063931.1 hypothetical protein [Erwinia sp. HR93]HEI8490419.1 hypothetical protein [Citrobacter koseri]